MRNTFMVVVLLIGATAIGFAQVDTGGLVGTVKDLERRSALQRLRDRNQRRHWYPHSRQD